MREQFVEIKTGEGVMEAFVTHPEDNGPLPPVILYACGRSSTISPAASAL
jgi:hypothetical protein